jgi:folate-dependent phosphoribosylglycinamide formyltransferase PurN
MRIIFIIDETPFFHPGYVSRTLKWCLANNHDVFVGIVKKIPNINSLQQHLIRNWTCIHPFDLIKLGLLTIWYGILDHIFPKGAFGRNFTVQSACNELGVPFLGIKKDIHSAEYMDAFRKFAPDLLVSSNSLLFKKALLELPTTGCINRHSSMLPKYGGVWPVLYAVLAEEEQIGITIHTMTENIDSGVILAQGSFPRSNISNLFKLYEQAFDLSVNLTVEAVRKINLEGIPSGQEVMEPEYNSFPTSELLLKFRNMGGNFI